MSRKKPAPDLIRGGNRFSEKDMRQRRNLGRIPINSIGMRPCERNKIVLADALQDEKYRRSFSGVGDEMRAFRWDGIRLTGRQPHLLLGVLKENTDRSYQDVECVLDIVVVVPRHFLLWADL